MLSGLGWSIFAITMLSNIVLMSLSSKLQDDIPMHFLRNRSQVLLMYILQFIHWYQMLMSQLG